MDTKKKSKKILVIRFSSIGDIVLTSPVVRCLKKQLGAEIHFLTKRSFKSILEPNPYLDRVYTFHKDLSEIKAQLKKEGYDYIVDLHKNLRSFQVKWMLWGTPHYSFDKLNLEKWLMVQFKVDQLPRLHIVDRYLGAVQFLGIKNDGQGLDYFIPEEDEIDTDQLLSSKGDNICCLSPDKQVHNQYTAFVIGAAHATKRLPREKIIEWCKKISGPLILLGGPTDVEEGKAIAEKAGDHVINTCGKLRLHQSASVVRQARLVITHDTGLMHIAAAFKRPIWSVWGNTTPGLGMYPYYPEGIDLNRTFEVEKLGCRPCSKIGYSSCPKGHFRCMQDIDIEPVFFTK